MNIKSITVQRANNNYSAQNKEKQSFNGIRLTFDKPKNFKKSGNQIFDMLRKYPKTVTAYSVIIAALTSAGISIQKKVQNIRKAQIVAMQQTEKFAASIKSPADIIKNLDKISNGTIYGVPNAKMLQLTLLPPSMKKSADNHLVPAELPAILGLKSLDPIYQHNPEINNNLYNFRKSINSETGISDIDNRFREGTIIQVPLSEIGKDLNALKLYIKSNTIEVTRPVNGGTETSWWSHSEL